MQTNAVGQPDKKSENQKKDGEGVREIKSWGIENTICTTVKILRFLGRLT